jgi:hypothetical protein
VSSLGNYIQRNQQYKSNLVLDLMIGDAWKWLRVMYSRGLWYYNSVDSSGSTTIIL